MNQNLLNFFECNRLRMMRRSKGFTLIEVLVVVAIIGILSSLAVVSFLEKIRLDRTQAASSIVKTFLESASLKVKRDKLDHSVWVNDNILTLYRSENCTGEILQKEYLPQPVRFTSLDSTVVDGLALSSHQFLGSPAEMGGNSIPLNHRWGNIPNCIQFKYQILNTVSAPGYLTLAAHYGRSEYAAVITKISSHNRFRVWIKNGSWGGPY